MPRKPLMGKWLLGTTIVLTVFVLLFIWLPGDPAPIKIGGNDRSFLIGDSNHFVYFGIVEDWSDRKDKIAPPPPANLYPPPHFYLVDDKNEKFLSVFHLWNYHNLGPGGHEYRQLIGLHRIFASGIVILIVSTILWMTYRRLIARPALVDPINKC